MTDERNAGVPRPARRNLVLEVIEDLRNQIAGGTYKPGERLPPESQLTEQFKVSRTVVREAIAGLRADGLVEPRQGAGVFVLEPAIDEAKPFQILDWDRISAIIEMLELRAAVEMEAASLAANRRSPVQEDAIMDACTELRRCAAAGILTTEADLAFHLAIADATNNPRFREFLEVMGVGAIPRAAMRAEISSVITPDYIEMLCNEHDQIADAICRTDPGAAREAMRDHLKRSQQRYRDLARHRPATHHTS
ncbi:FadR/GntR family transcriptional regulator [Acuticoccus sp. MNP-M23]|uniref:FadR/GntR family transcriptional regulator n=1 Tax=Acuticoccus sp. MNP-M23 TaxID=3072793 RepID=UPI0028162180|nr:FadR/GntR family transcriptional regulator [Acuticoccus sp. MNP-M23]WMS44166.1 FadR/GntR family transcriptional regulator [Acuticoccus sp. MNP-M23]